MDDKQKLKKMIDLNIKYVDATQNLLDIVEELKNFAYFCLAEEGSEMYKENKKWFDENMGGK